MAHIGFDEVFIADRFAVCTDDDLLARHLAPIDFASEHVARGNLGDGLRVERVVDEERR